LLGVNFKNKDFISTYLGTVDTNGMRGFLSDFWCISMNNETTMTPKGTKIAKNTGC